MYACYSRYFVFGIHAYVRRKIESTCPFCRVVRHLNEMLLRYELLSLVLIFCKRMS